MLGAFFLALPRRMVLAAASVVATTGAAGTSAEPPAPTVRWAIVGLGDVTGVKSGPPFWKCDGARLVAAMRRTPGKAAASTKVKTCTGARALINKSGWGTGIPMACVARLEAAIARHTAEARVAQAAAKPKAKGKSARVT